MDPLAVPGQADSFCRVRACDAIQRAPPGPGQRRRGAGRCLFPVPLRCVSRSSGNEIHRRPGAFRKVNNGGEAGGGYVTDRVPELAAVPAQPRPRHVQFDHYDALDPAAVGADHMEQRPGGPARRVKPDDRQPATTVAAQEGQTGKARPGIARCRSLVPLTEVTMTFRPFRLPLALAPLVVAVGIAAACVPYGKPGTKPTAPSSSQSGISVPSPQPTQSPYIAPTQPPVEPGMRPDTPAPPPPVQTPLPALPQPQPYSSQTSPAPLSSVPVWALSIVDGKLHLQTAEGTRSTCEKLTILISGVDPTAVAVCESLIRLTSGKQEGRSSDFLQATAQKVSRTGPDGATVVLEGNARLVYVRKGKRIDVSTDLVSVNLATGQVISEMDVPKMVTPVQPCCGTGSVPLACPPALSISTPPAPVHAN
jgi:hypothetical protein